jgi:hypothetical protein
MAQREQERRKKGFWFTFLQEIFGGCVILHSFRRLKIQARTGLCTRMLTTATVQHL